MTVAKCKISRRLGVNLFPKCSEIFARKPYPPGRKGKRRPRSLSEFGRQLKEKQKLKVLYNLRERQFRRYIKEALEKRGGAQDASHLLIQVLESRLDNVVLKLGVATSRAQAKQLVSHGFFLVNGKSIDIPSYRVKKGDVIGLKPQKAKKAIFQNLELRLKSHKPPSWLQFDKEKLEGKVLEVPNFEEAAPPVEISAIFEFYSR